MAFRWVLQGMVTTRGEVVFPIPVNKVGDVWAPRTSEVSFLVDD